MLLLGEGFPTELIFFLIVAVISLISRAFEKTKKIRQETHLRLQRKESAERMVLPGLEAVPPIPNTAPNAAPTLRELTAAAQLRELSKWHSDSPVETTRRVVPAPPPRRTRKQRPRVSREVDQHFVIRKATAHPVVTRIRTGGRAGLQEAVLLHEILGPPRAYRRNGGKNR